MNLLKAILLTLQVTEMFVTWLRKRHLISAGKAQQLAENLD